MQRWKAEVGRVREEKSRNEKIREEKEWEARRCRSEKVGKSRFTMFSPMIWGSGGSKSNLAKAAGAEPAGQMRDENSSPLWRETFPSQNVQNTPFSDHFWKLRCRKSARRCGAKHISKSKSTKHTILRPLLEVEMSKKCTPLWREAHVQVKKYKTHHSQTTFGSWDVEKVHTVVPWSTFPNQKVQNTGLRTTFGSWDVEKCTPLWRSTFPSQKCKRLMIFSLFWRSDVEKSGHRHWLT